MIARDLRSSVVGAARGRAWKDGDTRRRAGSWLVAGRDPVLDTH